MDSKTIFLLIPVFIIQIILIVIALKHLLKRNKTLYLDKTIWILIILFICIIGAVTYIALEGKEGNDSY